MQTRLYVHRYTHTHTHAHTRTHTRTHAHTRTYIHVHTHTYTYTHARAHTQIHCLSLQVDELDGLVDGVIDNAKSAVYLERYANSMVQSALESAQRDINSDPGAMFFLAFNFFWGGGEAGVNLIKICMSVLSLFFIVLFE